MSVNLFRNVWFGLVLFMIAGLTGCAIFMSSVEEEPKGEEEKIPGVMREFRGAWVATVANIDWPSKPGLTTEEQKAEAIAILEAADSMNLNAVIFQVRPQCDALYKSDIEPWSYYLTGEQGKRPYPYYDPLNFWIKESHNRGIELHAWFNPYRAHHPVGGEIKETSIVKQKPDLVRLVEGNYHWMNPADPRTQDHSFNVVMDVVKRYDIDGVHFDDYFYPYGDGSFEDDSLWTEYQKMGGELTRADWRRDHVNRFIKRLYDAIKQEKMWVKFGISPFGIWRPGNPESIRGFDQYKMLYADAKLWLNLGWVDYFTPQLYWNINRIPQSFPVLLSWWNRENTLHRNLWPGMYTSRNTGKEGIDEIFNEIMVTRGIVYEGPGHIHFSMKPLLHNRDSISTALREGPYTHRAVVPPSPWLDNEAPGSPDMKIKAGADSLSISWTHNNEKDVFRWALYFRANGIWDYKVFNRKERSAVIPAYFILNQGEENEERIYIDRLCLTAFDRTGNESAKEPVAITR